MAQRSRGHCRHRSAHQGRVRRVSLLIFCRHLEEALQICKILEATVMFLPGVHEVCGDVKDSAEEHRRPSLCTLNLPDVLRGLCAHRNGGLGIAMPQNAKTFCGSLPQKKLRFLQHGYLYPTI